MMNKYLEVFCKQNPEFILVCGHPDCKAEHTFKSKDVFKSTSFRFKCDCCGNSTTKDSSGLAKDITTNLKRAGITVR